MDAVPFCHPNVSCIREKEMKKQVIKNSTPAPMQVSIAPEVIPFMQKLNEFCRKKQNLIFWITLGFTILFGYLLFDVRVSLTGDDAAYIQRAKSLIDDFIYPGWQGPLYPFFLSFFIAIFGVNIVLLKSLSLFCIVGFQTFTYLTFRNRIPAFLMCAVLLLTSINAEILYYASQTYSEAFFMLISSVTIWFYVTYFADRKIEYPLKKQILLVLLLCFLLLCMGLARSAGFVGIVAVLTYGILYKKHWKETLYILVGFVLVFFVWQIVRNLLWKSGSVEFSGQLTSLLQKDSYDPTLGKEDLAGFIRRFWGNTNNYISYHFYEMWGIRKLVLPMTTFAWVSTWTYALAFVGLLETYKKNKILFFVGLYTGGFLVLTFFIMQTFWNQSRMIIPVVPYLLLVLFAGIYYFPTKKIHRFLQYILPPLVIVLLIIGLGRTSHYVREASRIIDKYYGLTPDFYNYIKMSEWAAENLPEKAKIVCRKPSISFIYTNGRAFAGISSVPSEPIDSLLTQWRNHPAQYLVFPQKELERPLTVQFVKNFQSHIDAYFFVGNEMWFFVKGDSAAIGEMKKQIEPLQISTETDIGAFVERTGKGNKNSVVYPDFLLSKLKNSSVEYVITASLRTNPAQKTEFTINTVERYLRFIEQKYPGILIPVAQTGKDEDEPSKVFKIDYTKAAIK